MKDRYRNFGSLQQLEKENIDYRITIRETCSIWSIIAPHGGGIEPGTSEIASAIAGDDYSLYLFEGCKLSQNRDLHIASTRFDEPALLQLLHSSSRTIAIHGLEDNKNRVYIGGKDVECGSACIAQLLKDGFTAMKSPHGAVEGMRDENVCNKNTTGRGVQIELSKGLRNTMFANLSRHGRLMKTPMFDLFVNAIRSVILQFPSSNNLESRS